MSLLAILEAIRSSGKDQLHKIEERAFYQTREILANARLDAEQLEDETYTAAVAPAIKERSRLLHHARLEALQIIGNVREKLVDAALERAQGYLTDARAKSSYPSILLNLVQEALTELEGSLQESGSVQLEADSRDREILENLLDEAGLALRVNYTLNTWGGVVAKSQDGRVVVINTLEARLERATPYLRRYLAALFENEHMESKRSQRVEKLVPA
ncbi:MAG: V-type ATP synthase subunit E [Anaerolineales bacterium]